jgi:hypothetical protein
MARNCRDVRAQAVDAGLDAAFAGDERRLRGSKLLEEPGGEPVGGCDQAWPVGRQVVEVRDRVGRGRAVNESLTDSAAA